MRHVLVIVVVASAVLAVGCASTKDIYVDYDRNADFKSYKTFAWGPVHDQSERPSNPLMHSRLKNAIEYYLTEGGLVEDTENPDLVVTYYGKSREQVSFTTTSMGYGYGPGWGWDPYWGGMGGMGMSTTTPHVYEEGTLIIDLWDTAKKTVVWRGSAGAVLKEDPSKQAEQIDEAVARIVEKWQKEYRKAQ